MKGKLIRLGYKLWCLCTHLSYLLSTEPYLRKYGTTTESINDLGFGGSVVVDMVGRLKTIKLTPVFKFLHELEARSQTDHFGCEMHWNCP